MANMKQFLTQYYSRLIFSNMNHEQFVQFCGYIKDKKATDNQKIWAEELLEKDPVTGEFLMDPSNTVYVKKPLPAETEMADAEWGKLFRAFRDAFQSMDSAKEDFKYNKEAKKFFENYFGPGKLFQTVKATPVAEALIGSSSSRSSTHKTLYKLLQNRKLITYLQNNGRLNDDFTATDLINGIDSKKYNTNPKFKKSLLGIVQDIYYISDDTDTLAKLGINPIDIPDFSHSSDWFPESVHPFTLDNFKRQYKNLLNKLHESKDVREEFSKHDNGKISGPLNKALEIQKYNDPESEDYVQPLREDSLNMPQRLSQWWSSTYSECIEKYTKLKGDRSFFSNEAKLICKHLEKNTKSTDGLDGILSNLGKAKEELKKAREFTAIKHLDWFEKTLNEIKKDPNMKHAWAQALQNGTNMKAIARAIMIRALRSDPVEKDKAKTALELISVFHYDYTTSKTMEALKGVDVSIFSDKDLSWNKNEGMAFVTKALDKSIKYAFLGLGYGVTIVSNAIRLSGRKIKRYSSDENFKKEHDDYLERQKAEKKELTDGLALNRTNRDDLQRTVDGIQAGRTYDVAKAEIENEVQAATTPKNASSIHLNNQIMNLRQTSYDLYKNRLIHVNDIRKIESFLNEIESWEPATTPPTTPPPLTVPILTTETVTDPTTGTTYDLKGMTDRLLTLFERYKRQANRLAQNEADLNNLVRGKENIDLLNAQIAEQENEVANWDANHVDELEELVKHWNLLETGRNTKTGPMYNWFRNLKKKNAQNRLNNQKASIIAHYNSTHSIAA